MTPPTRHRRLGVLVPSSNTTVEKEFRDYLPREISLHVGRLPLTRIAAESIVEIVRTLEDEAKKLATADVDLILLGATAPTFFKGLGYDREVSARIENGHGARPPPPPPPACWKHSRRWVRSALRWAPPTTTR